MIISHSKPLSAYLESILGLPPALPHSKPLSTYLEGILGHLLLFLILKPYLCTYLEGILGLPPALGDDLSVLLKDGRHALYPAESFRVQTNFGMCQTRVLEQEFHPGGVENAHSLRSA